MNHLSSELSAATQLESVAMDTSVTRQKEREYEQVHVHDVYNSIASHFSQTRYKPWPVVEQFLEALAPGSVGIDVGCGNGKYLAVRDDIFIMGSDRSDELVNIAKQHERHDALVADALDPPHPSGRFDFAVSIAVLHHLSTRERRIYGVRAILELLGLSNRSPQKNGKVGARKKSREDNSTCGQALFFVWALEQKSSRRGWDEGGKQDVLVPWVLKPSSESSRQGKPENKAKKSGKKRTKEVLENRQQNSQDKKKDVNSGYSEGANGSAEHSDRDTQEKISIETEVKHFSEERPPQVYQRYYHLYHQGELEEDVASAGGEIVRNGYDRDNWWCIAKRKVN